MTVVYIDALFLLNLIVNYLLLLAAAKLAGEPLRRLRLAAGAALGGLYAAAIFFVSSAAELSSARSGSVTARARVSLSSGTGEG